MRYAVMASCPSQIGDDKKVMEKVRKVSDWMMKKKKKTAAAAAAAAANSISFLSCPLTPLLSFIACRCAASSRT